MSWEVSSMPSKRSFFNRTLFRKNLSRSWPLWGLLSFAGAMVPLYLLLELLQTPRAYALSSAGFAEGLYQAVTIFAPGFTAAYAILCAMLVWGYLYNPRSVSLFHALPVDRTCLFITNTVSGMVMIVIPYAVVGLLLSLLAVCWGFFDLLAVLNTIVAVLFLTVTFFALATLCAMLTGHIFMLPALYLLVNFLSPMLEGLICSLAESFLIGIGEDRGRLTFLAPIVQIYTRFGGSYEYYAQDDANRLTLHGLWVVALYALAGLALLALAWFLYKKRHSECAGDVVAFRWMQPVFRYGVALLSGLTVGRLLYEALWRSIFQSGDYADVLPMWICVALGGLIGFYAASMLIEKSRRVFRGSLIGVGIVCAGAAALCLLVSVDVFGVERRVPAADEIKSVKLEDRGVLSGPFTVEDNPEQVEEIRAFHQAVIKDRDFIRSYSPNWEQEEGKVFSHNVWITYELNDGSTVRRYYDLWFTTERLAQEGTYESCLQALYNDETVRKRAMMIPEGTELSEIMVFCNGFDSYLSTEDSPGDAKAIYAAVQQDAEEGNVPAKNVLAYYGSRSLLWLELEYRVPISPWDGSWTYNYMDVYLTPEMIHTTESLLELGYLSEEDVERWRSDYASGSDGPSWHSETVYGIG